MALTLTATDLAGDPVAGARVTATATAPGDLTVSGVGPGGATALEYVGSGVPAVMALAAGAWVLTARRDRTPDPPEESAPVVVTVTDLGGGGVPPAGTEAPTWGFVTAGDFQMIDGRERVVWEAKRGDKSYAAGVVLDAFREPLSKQKAADKVEGIDLTLHVDAFKWEAPRDFVIVRAGDRVTDYLGGVYTVQTAVLQGCDDQYQLRCKRTGTA